MADVDMQRLKAIELDMLKAFIAVCEKHNLTYFLVAGTALGAVRHGGFIPWDDDIDVGMPREDYEKFMEVAQDDLPDGLFLQTPKTDPKYMTCFAKIRNTNTTFLESSASHLKINHGVFIDIFPLDGCVNYEEHAKSVRLLNIRVMSRFKFKRTAKERIAAFLIALRYPCAERARDRVCALWRKIPYASAEKVINYGSVYGKKELLSKDIYGKGRLGTFEGISVCLPEKTDEYLTAIYGDYMTPPPPEKQIAHHFCDIIDLDTPYTKYTKK